MTPWSKKNNKKCFKVLFLEWNIGCWGHLSWFLKVNSWTSAIEAFVSRFYLQLRDTSREQNISSKHAPQIIMNLASRFLNDDGLWKYDSWKTLHDIWGVFSSRHFSPWWCPQPPRQPGMNIVTKLGLLFALVVVFTLFSFYLGLFMTGPGLDRESQQLVERWWKFWWLPFQLKEIDCYLDWTCVKGMKSCERWNWIWLDHTGIRSPCASLQEPWLPMFLAVNTLPDSAGSLWRKVKGICFRWMLMQFMMTFFLLA